MQLTYDGEVKEQAHLGLGVDLALVAARVADPQAPDAQRVHGAPVPAAVVRHDARRAIARGLARPVARLVRLRARRRLLARHARVGREHVARVRQDLQVTGTHPRHLRHERPAL